MPIKKPKKSYPQQQSRLTAFECFPQDEKSRSILHERAQTISKHFIESSQKQSTDMFIHFYLGKTEKYGIPYQYTKEVIDHAALTRVPCAPHFIAGVVNRQGALISVLDLKQFFYNKPSTYDKQVCIIVVGIHQMTVGIIVDHIEGNAHYDRNTLDAALHSKSNIKTEYIIGIHQGITPIINIEAILLDIQRQKKPEEIIRS